ncbi:MAG TPA: PIN domain-containing protein [Pyrinomonadaceae bacterium]|nr:PIN domain-containing protein [Pyrinomonadaceae bacterium]
MRVLLDTNIIIHREASFVVMKEIGVLFNWLDKLGYSKCIHPVTINEIEKHRDKRVVETFKAKIKNYTELKTEAPETPAIQNLRLNDQSENDKNDSTLLKEVYASRVDLMISEDGGVRRKAGILGITDRVLTIDEFLEKVTAEHPDLASYKVLAVKREHFGNINLADPFFDSFKRDYVEFAEWFNRKADEVAYICKSERDELIAFLYVKLEDEREPYSDIEPPFRPRHRLKVGTFKVSMNGYKLGERFLKIIFDNAVRQNVDEIYVTIFDKDTDQRRLITLLSDWGFRKHGVKRSKSGDELVYVRDFAPKADPANPALTYPYVSAKQRKFIVAIYPQYHTELLPDSILRTESATNYLENRPNRNALRKVYISRSHRKDMVSGDIIVFYRTASGGAGHYTSVATTLGVVESVIHPVPSLEDFIRLCRKRSVFSDDELKQHWNYYPKLKPFIVNFLFIHSFPKRPNLATLKEEKIIVDAPRGFDEIPAESFQKLITISNANKRLIVD